MKSEDTACVSALHQTVRGSATHPDRVRHPSGLLWFAEEKDTL
jgi:hypothetical protein